MMAHYDFSSGAYRPPPGTMTAPKPALRRAREIGAIETWLHRDLASRYGDTMDENLPADLLDLIGQLPS